MSMASRWASTVRRLHLAVQAGGDVGLARDLLDQIARHALLERVAAHHQSHLAGVIGEVQRGLASRVAGADEEHVLPVRRRGFAARRAVVDALADEAVEAFDDQPSPRHAGGHDDAARAHMLAAVENHLARRRVHALDASRDEDFSAQPARLLQRAAGQFVAGYAVRKAQVVLDARRGAGLPAGCFALDDQRAQALAGTVHRGSQPGGPAADDQRVVDVLPGASLQAQPHGQLAHRRLAQQRTVGQSHDRAIRRLGEAAGPRAS